MAREVAWVCSVVDIVDLDLELLAPLKVVLDVETLDPDRVEIVHDDLCHTQALPLRPSLLVEDQEAIRAGECIQVGQVLAGEIEANGLHEATLGRVDTLIDGCKHGVVKIATNSASSLHCARVLVRAEARGVVANRCC